MDLFTAIDQGDLPAALAALAADPAAGHRVGADRTAPVLHALYRGRADIATALADRLDRLDLAEASALDRTDLVAAALDGGAPVDARTPDGFTPLQLAAFFGAGDAAALLVARGADLDAVADNEMRIQPLHAATAGRHREIALLLVAAGAAPGGRQRHGWTPLMAAADHGDAEVVAALLAAGADPAATNDDGVAAAELARANGHADLADQLAAALPR